MKKSAVEQSEVIICEECEVEIYTCDDCKDYFSPGEICWCDDGKHYCDTCKECKDDKENK